MVKGKIFDEIYSMICSQFNYTTLLVLNNERTCEFSCKAMFKFFLLKLINLGIIIREKIIVLNLFFIK